VQWYYFGVGRQWPFKTKEISIMLFMDTTLYDIEKITVDEKLGTS
jgi:hypothetical protein